MESITLTLTSEEHLLLLDALNSHRYWQLSDAHYRSNGEVHGVGSDDAENVVEIQRVNALEERLEALTR